MSGFGSSEAVLVLFLLPILFQLSPFLSLPFRLSLIALPTNRPNPSFPPDSLPGIALPDNVVAIPDLVESVKGATYLIFVLPHQCESSPHLSLSL